MKYSRFPECFDLKNTISRCIESFKDFRYKKLARKTNICHEMLLFVLLEGIKIYETSIAEITQYTSRTLNSAIASSAEIS